MGEDLSVKSNEAGKGRTLQLRKEVSKLPAVGPRMAVRGPSNSPQHFMGPMTCPYPGPSFEPTRRTSRPWAGVFVILFFLSVSCSNESGPLPADVGDTEPDHAENFDVSPPEDTGREISTDSYVEGDGEAEDASWSEPDVSVDDASIAEDTQGDSGHPDIDASDALVSDVFDPDVDEGPCLESHCVPEGYVYVPSGRFTMGAPPSEPGFHPERENGQHDVILTRGFFIKQTVVTQGEWAAVMGSRPAYFGHCGDDCPVERVNWWEMLAYANALSESEGLPRCYNLTACTGRVGEGCRPTDRDGGQRCVGYVCSVAALGALDLDCAGYRLPTESEWEYAARAGTSGAFVTASGAMTQWDASTVDVEMNHIAWYKGNSAVSYPGGVDCSGWYDGAVSCGTHPVAQKAPNGWGLHDVTGNVWERVWDWFGAYPEPGSLVTDPVGPSTGTTRTMRGGTFALSGQYLRVAYRTSPGPEHRFHNVGFRLVRTARTVQDDDVF
jgi:formylglycine-generating enzyme required for sulfatase activity